MPKNKTKAPTKAKSPTKTKVKTKAPKKQDDQFCNPYHFVPAVPIEETSLEQQQHWLCVQDDFKKRKEDYRYDHSRYYADSKTCYSGRIICKLTAEEPFFIGASNKREANDKQDISAIVAPFELDGKPAIPASTLRGLLSSIVEAASNSTLRVLNNDQYHSIMIADRNNGYKPKYPNAGGDTYDFFERIDPELIPFHKERMFLSPAELLFGFVQKDDDDKNSKKAGLALAGRVQLSFGLLAPEEPKPYYEYPDSKDGQGRLLKVLGSPQLPCPMMYFKNRYTEGKAYKYITKTDFNLDKHIPQGRKMYVHSHRDNGKEPWKSLDDKNNKHLKVMVNPIRQDATFYFHVDFENLDEWELGLLCYALRPTNEFRHKLGMGKSIGLGTIRIDPIGLFLIDRQTRYQTKDIFKTTRYHQTWVDTKNWPPPESMYERERTEHELPATKKEESWQDFRDIYFVDTMHEDIKQALELLGNPDKVSAKVHTPQVAGKEKEEMERETYAWYGENENHRHKMLLPLYRESQEIPSLTRWHKTQGSKK